jgi:hypothetical protein
VVLKQERRDLYVDAMALFAQQTPLLGGYRDRQCEWWDVSDLCSWPQVQTPVRVIRSRKLTRYDGSSIANPNSSTATGSG